MKKAKRYITARMLHVGCNAIDSIRAVQWVVAMTESTLTEKELRLLSQRNMKVKECTADVRKIANHIERKTKES